MVLIFKIVDHFNFWSDLNLDLDILLPFFMDIRQLNSLVPTKLNISDVKMNPL